MDAVGRLKRNKGTSIFFFFGASQRLVSCFGLAFLIGVFEGRKVVRPLTAPHNVVASGTLELKQVEFRLGPTDSVITLSVAGYFILTFRRFIRATRAPIVHPEATFVLTYGHL